MINKNLLVGILVGLFFGGISPVYSYYSGGSKIGDLSVSDFKELMEDDISIKCN